MMENHSFDNLLGLIGRGDGFTLGPDGTAHGHEPRRQGQRRPRLPHADANARPTGVGNDWNGGPRGV